VSKAKNTPMTLREEIFEECRAMTAYCFANGNPPPVEIVAIVDAFTRSFNTATDANFTTPDIEPLVNAHRGLSDIVKPALPRTILLLNKEQRSNSFWHFLGPVAVIRQMMMASYISLIIFVIFSLWPEVNTAYIATQGAGKNILDLHGTALLKNLIFYISAAGLGAGFAALYKANRYITDGTFDPTYHASYWIRFSLGLIAGLVLAVMISGNALNATHGTPGDVTPLDTFLDPGLLRPMLAMLGGFSADLLYTVMNRLVETVESLFRGSTKNLINMKQQEAEAQIATGKVQNQMNLASKLVKLQQELGGDIKPAEIQAKIDKLLTEMMPNIREPGA
jgi:hypothetical protein